MIRYQIAWRNRSKKIIWRVFSDLRKAVQLGALHEGTLVTLDDGVPLTTEELEKGMWVKK